MKDDDRKSAHEHRIGVQKGINISPKNSCFNRLSGLERATVRHFDRWKNLMRKKPKQEICRAFSLTCTPPQNQPMNIQYLFKYYDDLLKDYDVRGWARESFKLIPPTKISFIR